MAVGTASRAGRKLRKWRESQRERSQEKVAALIGVTQAAWSTWEEGLKRPSIHFALAIEAITKGAVCVADWQPSAKERAARRAALSRGGKRSGEVRAEARRTGSGEAT